MFQKALGIIRAKVIAKTKVFLCTQQIVRSELVRHNFACAPGNETVIIADEDGVSIEPVSWIPITLPRYAPNLRAVLRFGDRKQLRPLVSSGSFNEFAQQLNRSLLDRHLRHHEPIVRLNQQYRMHPALSRFPNEYTYGGLLVDDPSCSQISIDPVVEKGLQSWILSKSPGATINTSFLRLMGVNVQSGQVQTHDRTFSKFNTANISVICEMLFQIYESEPYPEHQISIITLYTAQRDLHLRTRQMLHQKTGLPYEKLPQIATVGSMQGHESESVILDLVSDYNSKLGFLSDDRRLNVAITRARASLTVVWRCDLDVEPNLKSKPEVIHLWDFLSRHGLVVNLDRPENTTLEPENGASIRQVHVMMLMDIGYSSLSTA